MSVWEAAHLFWHLANTWGLCHSVSVTVAPLAEPQPIDIVDDSQRTLFNPDNLVKNAT